MIEYDPKVNLQHHPTPMARFGMNPFGEPLYRIVFTESRRHLIGGAWGDGEVGYHWVRKYPSLNTAWILERWYTAFEFTRMSQPEWDCTMVDPISGWLILGPYPSRGEYDLAHEFDHGVSADNLDNIVAAIERGRNRSFQDVRDAHRAEWDKEQSDWKKAARDEIRDVVTAFGVAPISSLTGVSRGTKNPPEMHSAESLNLPIPKPAKNPVDIRGLKVSSSFYTTAKRRIA